jgi:hypothetical protein
MLGMGKKAGMAMLEEAHLMNSRRGAVQDGIRNIIKDISTPQSNLRAVKPGYSAPGFHSNSGAPKIVPGDWDPMASKFGDAIPGRKMAGPSQGAFNPEVLPHATETRVLNSESFGSDHSGANASIGAKPVETAVSGNKWANAAHTFFSGAIMDFKGGPGMRLMGAAAGFGVAGAATNLALQTAFPNNFEYQGMVAPILKGAVMGAAMGMAHSGLGRMAGNQAYKGNEFLQNVNSFVNNRKGKALMFGAVGASTWAGTGESHLTRPIN